MLQSSSSSPSSSSHINSMNTSVLERQRDVLQRLYHHHQQQNDGNDPANLNFDYQQILLSHCSWQPVNRELKPDHHHSYTTISDGNKSSMTRAIMSKPDHPQFSNSSTNREAFNVPSSTKKRKAEFDTEEEGKDIGPEGEEKSEITAKGDGETWTKTCSKSEVEEPDYIHVRARRGQATDSHSLAERARREKISKKMKDLQDLVPGCDKVSGKAGMLDEIINYVQSLQKQVEFLSMKLSTLNPRLDLSMDSFFAKEIPAYISQLEAANSTCLQYNRMQQGVADHIQMDQTQKAGTSSFLSEAFVPQLQLSGWDPDLASLFNVSFH